MRNREHLLVWMEPFQNVGKNQEEKPALKERNAVSQRKEVVLRLRDLEGTWIKAKSKSKVSKPGGSPVMCSKQLGAKGKKVAKKMPGEWRSRTSTEGHSCRSHWAKLRMEAMELRSTSPSRRQASFEAAWISARAHCPRSRFRQARITRAPRRASSWDTAFPMPVEEQPASRLVREVTRGQWGKGPEVLTCMYCFFLCPPC
ncbi:hypothetical protein HJG60_011200 [Phyllostomus discolor]|uniref:Uncharacterized protein n=1 Tax=Phyllostomus discolor TaxID=89673 RepID=A0A834E7J9_9CHIR|nr:hypothetical protein HJG60_011200 [Phyllostomus discolor]